MSEGYEYKYANMYGAIADYMDNSYSYSGIEFPSLYHHASVLKRMPFKAMLLTVIGHVKLTTALGISLLFFRVN